MALIHLIVAALLSSQSPVPGPVAQDQPSSVEEVIVTAPRSSEEERRESVSAFVRQLAKQTRDGRLARWDGHVCPGVSGLPAQHAAYVADRLTMEAQAIGLDTAQPGCAPNILIVVTSRPDKTAADLRRRHGRLFRSADRVDSGSAAEPLFNSRRPVRWWHAAQLSGADGRPNDPSKRLPGASKFFPISTGAASRLYSHWKEDLAQVLVIVDSTRTKGLTYEQLASYLAMVTLAQVDAEVDDLPLPTITTLFADRAAGRAPQDTLTEWDRAYLKGLYEGPPDAPSVTAQAGAIRRSMEQVARN